MEARALESCVEMMRQQDDKAVMLGKRAKIVHGSRRDTDGSGDEGAKTVCGDNENAWSGMR